MTTQRDSGTGDLGCRAIEAVRVLAGQAPQPLEAPSRAKARRALVALQMFLLAAEQEHLPTVPSGSIGSPSLPRH